MSIQPYLLDSLIEFHRRGDLKGFLNAGGHVHQWLDIASGILPAIGQSIPETLVVVSTKRSIQLNYSTRLYVDVKAWRPFGWNLPSNGIAYDYCGHIWYDEGQGCLNVQNHPEGKIYVRLVGATCFRFECPKCYQKACARGAGQIEDKFKRLSNNNAEAHVPGLGRPVHAVISVPEVDAYLMYDKNNYKRLRSKIYAIAGDVGIVGACCIFHPYANEKLGAETPEKILIDKSTGDFDLESLKAYYAKMDKNINFWYLRPHFHIIGYAPRDFKNPENDAFTPEKINAVYEETGYVVINLGVRDSVRNTAHYQLSHCGVRSGFQTVTWFGKLSNRKYRELNPRPKFKPKKHTCPECEAELAPVLWDPVSDSDPWIKVEGQWVPRWDSEHKRTPSPLLGLPEGGYLIDPGGWRYLYPGEKLHSCLVQRPKKDPG